MVSARCGFTTRIAHSAVRKIGLPIQLLIRDPSAAGPCAVAGVALVRAAGAHADAKASEIGASHAVAARTRTRGRSTVSASSIRCIRCRQGVVLRDGDRDDACIAVQRMLYAIENEACKIFAGRYQASVGELGDIDVDVAM